MIEPRRRGIAAAGVLVLLLHAAACGDDESLDPTMRAPATGIYEYEALVYTAEGEEPDTFAGTLDIDVSSEDSIVGTWNVDGYEDLARGIWNITAYALIADPEAPLQGTITHRVSRESSGSLSCDLTYVVEMPADTFTSSAENDCSLQR
jgi:hypothetical protein